jgi:hypothetical protein
MDFGSRRCGRRGEGSCVMEGEA